MAWLEVPFDLILEDDHDCTAAAAEPCAECGLREVPFVIAPLDETDW